MYYRRETPRFNFEKFIDHQKEYYKRLRDVGYNNGIGLNDASKCSNLKLGPLFEGRSGQNDLEADSSEGQSVPPNLISWWPEEQKGAERCPWK